MQFRNVCAAFAALSILVVGLPACGSGGSDDGGGEVAGGVGPKSCEPTAGGDIVVAYADALSSFDFAKDQAVGVALNADPLVFDRLVSVSRDLTDVTPQLATSVEPNEDYTEWTIKLRQGVTFHDGSKFDAADAKFSLEYTLEGFNAYTLGPVEQIETPDPYTVRITYKAPYSRLPLQGLASISGYMIPKDFAGEKPADFFSAPIGTGPFKVSEFRPTELVKFEKNDDYWQADRPYLDSIEMRFVSNSNDRVLGLESGDFDFINNIPPDRLDALPEDTIPREVDAAATTEVWFNSNTDLLADENVRHAISAAINRDEIVHAAYVGHAKPAGTFLPDQPNVEPPASPNWVTDLDEARKLMSKSRFPDGGQLELMYFRENPIDELQAEVIQQNLSEIGIDVKLVPTGYGQAFDVAGNGDFEAWLFSSPAVSPDSIDYLGFDATTEPSGFYGDWDVGPVKDLIARAEATDDDAELEKIYSEYEELKADNATQIATVSGNLLAAQSRRLSGLDINPLGYANFAAAWICGEGS